MTNEIIKNQEEEKTKIETKIVDKKKYKNKIILKDKATLLKENEELKNDLRLKEHQYRMLEEEHNTLKSKVDYLLSA